VCHDATARDPRPPAPLRLMDGRDFNEHRILTELEADHPVTQRSLSRDLGIALGLTNLLMRRLVKKGFVRISPAKTHGTRYLLTPAGALAKARLGRTYLLESLRVYQESKARVGERIAIVAADLEQAASPCRAVAFYGASPVAEIAFICLADTGLDLVGVVDDEATGLFVGIPVHHDADLAGTTVGGRRFDKLIVMPSAHEDRVRTALAACNVPPEAVFWL
jgi:DNA-binding MarR family transcriptional regulator